MRILLRVKPGASRTAVGGRYDGRSAVAGGPALVVAVAARAVEGQATKAVLEAVAEAFGVRRSAVRMVRGATSRNKLVEIEGEESDIRPRFEQLLG